MAKSKSWSVKGIAPETRDTARDAAQAAGLPIGTWIDNAILKAARGELTGFLGRSSLPYTADAAVQSTTDTAPPAGVPPTAPPDPAPVRESIPEHQVEVAEPAEAAAQQPSGPAPAAAHHRLVARPDDRFDPDAAPTADPRPLPSPDIRHQRPGVARYVVAATLLLAVLVGIVWILLSDLGAPQPPNLASITPNAANPSSGTAATPPGGAATAPSEATAAAPDPSTAPTASGGANDLRQLLQEANTGNAEAQYNLGMLHLNGNLVPKSATEAAKWFEKAAVAGLPNAQFNLGVLYQQGTGVVENQQLAFFWYQSAAEQKFARAQHNLAAAYAAGRGVPRNDAKAVEWFTRAAENGLAESQFSLGVVYEDGMGAVKPDLDAARKWFSRAAAQGDPQSVARLAVLAERLGAATPKDVAYPVNSGSFICGNCG